MTKLGTKDSGQFFSMVLAFWLVPSFFWCSEVSAQKMTGTTKEVDIVFERLKLNRKINKLYATGHGVYCAVTKETFQTDEIYKIDGVSFVPTGQIIQKPLLNPFNHHYLQYYLHDSLFIHNDTASGYTYGSRKQVGFFNQVFLVKAGNYGIYQAPFHKNYKLNAYFLFDYRTGQYFSFLNRDTLNQRSQVALLVGTARLVHSTPGKTLIHLSNEYILQTIDNWLPVTHQEYIAHFAIRPHKLRAFEHGGRFYVFSPSEKGVRMIDTLDMGVRYAAVPMLTDNKWVEDFYYDPIGKGLYTLKKEQFQYRLYQFDWESMRFIPLFAMKDIDPAVFCVSNRQIYTFVNRLKTVAIIRIE